MATSQLTIIALSVESVLYFLLLIVALWRNRLRDRAGRALALYAAVSGLWILGQLAWLVGWLDILDANVYLMVRLPAYGTVLLALLFLYLTRAFLRLPGRSWGWFILGILWIAGLVILDANPFAIPNVLWISQGWGLSRSMLSFGLAIAGWGLFMAVPFLSIHRAYRQAKLPLHRNRLTYWLIAWAITVAGDLLFFAGREVIGGDVRLLGTLIAAYVVLTHRLPDVRQALRRVISYLVITILTVAIYTAGFTLIQTLFQDLPGYSPLLAGAAVALILAVLFDPLLHLIQRFVNRLIRGSGYDPAQMVGEYSLRISNIVSLERLATVAVSRIREAFGTERGALFVVNHKRDREGNGYYELQSIRTLDTDLLPAGNLSDGGAVTHHMREERRPLTQYDIDLLPEFKDLPAVERDWMSELGMDVYVPIHAQESWIGLLALGTKSSGDRYFDQDLTLLNTLADQTAVALENARLVDDLIEINADLEQAYADLEKINRQLQEMDKLKSAFIGVITHELKSPFANIAFSLQIFSRHGLENLSPAQREQLDQLTGSLQQAKSMVDNLVTFATFLSKQGELSLGEVDFREVLQGTLLPLKPMLDTKELNLRVIAPEELPHFQGDQGRLSDAIHHLIHNAIKFTPAGGEVWLRAQTSERDLLFEVKDNGVGIPAEKLPTLWEGFTQMADPLKRGVEGLGLGLALVKYIITAHGGEVWAESQEGQGSTFGFRIPLAGPGTPSR